ncbi:hypothetical protein BO94DRAFT_465823 [Aspergillus sclerotioniger CBS 115572]|uniref:RNA helicase HEL117 n=1 Tax=Aspergillus sclerotioniger CBS 115572 TaxID=1450535 RepID=A0A317WUB9_9EURO|nr:hypothetical protein BO94DRAFT_465823 [Aspergillus sclerotioniger CBS 115572]PWY87840.1 hypothetical protein BO94DRAFT_465823 [Aspergillus sclerotioniger CBS 115572]
MSTRDRHPDSHPHSHSHRDRTRSRSPNTTTSRSDRHRSKHHHHRYHRHDRSRDHDRHRRDRHTSRQQPEPSSAPPPAPVILPFQARELRKRDLEYYAPMFDMYLDIQKGIVLDELAEDEVKGRWKSFMRKWNQGELAEGWYDPATLEKARNSVAQMQTSTRRDESQGDRNADVNEGGPEEEGEDEEDEYGPVLPTGRGGGMSSGPTIPTMQDLELRKELAAEDAIAERHDSRAQYRSELRSHKSEVRHMQEEVAPRAEPGTHERRMEKRQEAAASNRAFAEAKRGGSPEGAPEEELMGSGENDLEGFKKAREREQRKKNEREIRREELLRARAAEREERLQQYRQKEEETIGWLKTLAKQRFG